MRGIIEKKNSKPESCYETVLIWCLLFVHATLEIAENNKCFECG